MGAVLNGNLRVQSEKTQYSLERRFPRAVTNDKNKLGSVTVGLKCQDVLGEGVTSFPH